jgi:RNA polymerase sigma factor (sigma-70 family)
MRTELAAMPDANGGTSTAPTGFEKFFRSEYPIVVRIGCGILRDVHLAEDVAQEVLSAAQQRFSEPYDSNHVHAWVKIAAAHASLNAIRGKKRLRDRLAREQGGQSPPNPEDLAVANEEDRDVRRALARLPRHSATVLVLRHSGLSYAEVADAMGVPINQVGTMLRRAETRFRKEVQRETRS